MPTQAEVESVILNYLAEELGQDPVAIRMDLSSKGEELPIDSFILVEILTRVEARFQVRVEESPATAAMLRSVHGFTTLIYTLIEAKSILLESERSHGHRS